MQATASSTSFSSTQTANPSNRAWWTGRIMSGLAVLFLLFDAAMKLARIAPVLEATARLGYPTTLAFPIGVLLLICTIAYAIPRSSVLGAILLTGYLGGAVASQVRIGAPLFSQALFPVYVAVLIWGGLYLREKRLQDLVPLRSARSKQVDE